MSDVAAGARIALGVEYRGCAYQGWERQRNGPTVQAVLEAALQGIAGGPVRTVCAGRTDSGVHAWGQVVHFDAPARRPLQAWCMGTNTHLPGDVNVAWAQPVTADFHARFSATARSYRYLIFNRRTRPAPLAGLVSWIYRPLDAALMHEAAQILLGEHDFSAFRASGCQAHSPVRTIEHISIEREGDFICLDVRANAFLQHMVRNIAGVLVAVGSGQQPVRWVGDVLGARQRSAGGVTAAPDGLYLCGVRYPAHHGLPELSRPRALW